MSEKDKDIKYMENLLNQPSEDESSQSLGQLDYHHPHAEIINLIQALVDGKLVDGSGSDNVQDKFYSWLADFKNLHSVNEFNLLIQELRQKFTSQMEFNPKIKLLFEVLNDLID